MRIHRANCCPRTSRATSWASARRSIFSKPSIAAWTCSIASSRRRSRSAAPFLLRAAFCNCAAAFTNFPTKSSIPTCACPTCARYSRAYLHHLTKTSETLGWQLLGKHNIHFYHQLMREIRAEHPGRSASSSSTARNARSSTRPTSTIRFASRSRSERSCALTLGDYEVHIAREGFASIRQISSGEIMHSRTPPMEEAQKALHRAIAISRRDAAPQRNRQRAPLVIWDVGLGAAANAMAAIHCYEEQAAQGPVRPLHIISFENDLDSLRLAFRHNRDFPYLRHGGPAANLEDGGWQSRAASGPELAASAGRFPRDHGRRPAPPDLIFYDMFSSKTCADPWTMESFRKLFAACAGRAAELFTYTCSTAIRAALARRRLLRRARTEHGEKQETTIALTPEAYRYHGSPPRNALARMARALASLRREVPAGAGARSRDRV